MALICICQRILTATLVVILAAVRGDAVFAYLGERPQAYRVAVGAASVAGLDDELKEQVFLAALRRVEVSPKATAVPNR